MRNKILWFSYVFLFITLASFSQKRRYLYYFDKDLNPVEKAKSVFNGTGFYEDGLMELRVYSSLNNNLVYIQHFTDSSLGLSNGFFESYYANGSKEWKGNYLEGKEDGLWQRRDCLGRVIDSTVYKSGEKISEVHAGYQKNGLLDSLIVNDIKADKLQKIYYDSSGKVQSEVCFAGQKGFEKVYKNGMMESSDSVFSRDETEASFPGGDMAWTKYLVENIIKNSDGWGQDYGTCEVKFIVDTNGNIDSVEATAMCNAKLIKVAVNLIRNAPKWNPAVRYGKPVRAYKFQPLTLRKGTAFQRRL